MWTSWPASRARTPVGRRSDERGLPAAGCALAAKAPPSSAMSKTRREVLDESRRKGIAAGAMAATTVVLGAAGLPFVAVVAAVPTAVMGWRWWKHRAENGIKF